MGSTSVRYAWLGLVVVLGAVLIAALPAVVEQRQVAHAEQIRARCVRELSAKGAWRADITESETGSDGATVVSRQQLLVRRPGEYRLTLRERDTDGREVVSTTIRAGQTFHTLRTNADGSTELHVIKGARPSLGIELDNLLGQTVRAIADAAPLKIVGTEKRRGMLADKLELGAGQYVWVDQATGMPVEEQVVAAGKVAHSVVITRFDDRVTASDSEFDPASLGGADTTTVEDLGFRTVVNSADAAGALGFTPLDVPEPAGFSEGTKGYVDPGVPTGDGSVEPAFVETFSHGTDGVIVTQVLRPGSGDTLVPTGSDADSFDRVDVDGKPAALFHDAAHKRLVFVRRDVLVTIEGNLTESAMRNLAERIR